MSNSFDLPMPVLVCTYCHREIKAEAGIVFNEGLPYHEHCLRFEVNRDLKNLRKRADTGMIRANEVHVMEELQSLDNILRVDSNKSAPKNHINMNKAMRFCKSFRSSEFVCNPEGRAAVTRTALEASRKKREALRGEVWGWQAFNILEKKELKLLEEHENTIVSTEN